MFTINYSSILTILYLIKPITVKKTLYALFFYNKYLVTSKFSATFALAKQRNTSTCRLSLTDSSIQLYPEGWVSG